MILMRIKIIPLPLCLIILALEALQVFQVTDPEGKTAKSNILAGWEEILSIRATLANHMISKKYGKDGIC